MSRSSIFTIINLLNIFIDIILILLFVSKNAFNHAKVSLTQSSLLQNV